MVRLGRIGVLTLMFCGLMFGATSAFSGQFEIRHQTSYAYMPVPGTPGEPSTFEWGFDSSWADIEVFDLPVVGDPADVSVNGLARLGPLRSLNAEWNPDGSIGDADYLFGKGKFELELVFNLLNGTPHTMTVRGATGPTSVSVSDSCCGHPMATSAPISMSFLHAKVDRESAALFGIERQVSGSSYYYTDVYNMGGLDREIALFGSLYFDYTPAHRSQSADLTAVPEPGILSLIGLGVAAAMLRRRR